jgi:hypothetical protein
VSIEPHLAGRAASNTEETRARYDVLGVRVSVRSALPAAIDLIDGSYGPFRVASGGETDAGIELRASAVRSGEFEVITADRSIRAWATSSGAALDLLEQLVMAIVSGLHRRGLYGIHAAALGHRERSLILVGDSGSGKTTLALALAARGLELLSDELAVLDPLTGDIHPYARRVHVRPGTPELVEGLEPVARLPRRELGGGIAWSLERDAVGRAGTIPRALGWIILLEPRPATRQRVQLRDVAGGLAAMRVLRGTWAASVDFDGSLAIVGGSVAGLPAASVIAGQPMETADAIIGWLDAHDARA